MDNPSHFILAVMLVLGTPGPTNTLLATAAATAGWRRSLVLMPAEMAGYTISIGTLLILVRPYADSSVIATVVLRAFCALYLLKVGWTLWTAKTQTRLRTIRFRQVFIATLLNPKGIIFAFLIFPGPSAEVSWQLCAYAVFLVICAAACASWLALGAIIGKQTGSFVTPQRFQRGAALVLTLFALVMTLSIAR